MSQETANPGPVFLRTALAIGFGLAGAVAIWVVSPWSAYYFQLGFISDSYLPVLGLFLILVLCGILNPMLRRWAPSIALERQHGRQQGRDPDHAGARWSRSPYAARLCQAHLLPSVPRKST